jgi:hypothetical protein
LLDRARGVMSISIAILKVLSSHPDGRASFASLKADLAMLTTPEWSARMHQLGRRTGPISLFSMKLATRDANGWAITELGREYLRRLDGESEMSQVTDRPVLRVVVSRAVTKKPSEAKSQAVNVARSA